MGGGLDCFWHEGIYLHEFNFFNFENNQSSGFLWGHPGVQEYLLEGTVYIHKQ